MIAAWPVELVNDILGNVGALGAVVALAWFRDLVAYGLAGIWHRAYALVTRQQFVLVWLDDEGDYGPRLVARLEAHDDGQGLYRFLSRPRSLLFFPLRARYVRAVVMLDTDVTKLADQPRVARRIERRLRDYVLAGGGLVAGHDLIYRRVRTTMLQQLFGCQVTDFQRQPARPVAYRAVAAPDRHPLRSDLPDRFTLDDGEVCWGAWAPGTLAIYTTDDEHARPLVVARECGAAGRVVWLNSGDKSNWMCASIATPEEPLVLLLRNAVTWVASRP